MARVWRARPDYTIGDYFRTFPIHRGLVGRAFAQLGVRE
jgi:hypothetical protein